MILSRAVGSYRSFLQSLALFFAGLATAASSHAETVLVPTGANWRYLADGSDQGTAWRAAAFADAAWPGGVAEFGYGDTVDGRPEATVIACGPSAPTCNANNFITSYFRRPFPVNPTGVTALSLRVLRDDGAVVYLNGTEVFRTNMPAGTITSSTLASSGVSGDVGETVFLFQSLAPGLLVAGVNVLAVEVHQASAGSSDVSFDLELIANPDVTLTRGPYLQLATPTSAVVRWRVTPPTATFVHYGTDPMNLTLQVAGSLVDSTYSAAVTGLDPDTKYFYSVETNDTVLAGGDDKHFFVTYPPLGAQVPARMWVLGDSGTASMGLGDQQEAVRDAYFAFAGRDDPGSPEDETHVWLMLGDNAYPTGTDGQHQAAVFDMYPTMLRNTFLWPTFGNHESPDKSAAATSPYYEIFELPEGGEAGGLASGNEAYYAFDYGNIHFISLDSFATDRVPTEIELVASGAVWRYLDDGSNQGTAWRASAFADGAWASGSAELGYGDTVEGRPEATVIDCGPSAPACNANNFITSYFRHTFSLGDPSTLAGFDVDVAVMRDDGAVVYLNGTEILRTNMPVGVITSSTLASSSISGATNETAFTVGSLDSSLLIAGDNVLAVEVHQVAAGSSDVSFDLTLSASADPLDETGAMLTWLEADLSSLGNETDWVVAFWHHPPYSKGSHDSDTELELIDMRAKVLPILEDHGVDLVLSGHSHSYERSVLIDGHYGLSGECAAGECFVDGGDGDPDGDGAYQKALGTAHSGSVYAVAGSSGQVSGGTSLDHPVMLELAPENAPNGRGLAVLGSMVIDVDAAQLDASFLDAEDPATVRDHFAVVPEPGGPLMFVVGLVCLRALGRRRTKSSHCARSRFPTPHS